MFRDYELDPLKISSGLKSGLAKAK